MFIVTALVAWLSSNNPQNTFGIFILVGLCFGLFGDVFLDLKFIVKEHELLFTILGFFAFAFGHISYISGLFLNYFSFTAHVLYVIIPLIVTLVLVLFTSFMDKFSNINYQKMKPYVAIYGFFLFFVTSIYLSAAIQNGWQNMTVDLMFASFILFAASDLVLNNTYFAPGFNKPIFIIINHVLYYLAQFLIAVSLFFLL